MKILFQYFTGGGGGLSNIISLLQAILRTYPQDQIDIVCSKYSDFQTLDGLPNFEILPFGREKTSELYRLLLGVGKLRRLASIRNADVIWSINLGCYLPGKIPHIISIHNAYQVYPWFYVKYHPDSRLHVAILRWFFRKSLYISDGVIVQTPTMAEYIQKTGRPPDQIAVIPKATETSNAANDSFLPLNLKRKLPKISGTKPFTFIYVATYLLHKNHKVLIETFDLLMPLRINIRLILTISMNEVIAIGGETAKRLVEGGYLIPIGWVKKENLKALYKISDACLMPSVLESLSSSHLEAMAWGKPQIISDLPYFKDVCGNAAFYASAEDPHDWAQKIQLLIQDKNLREKLVMEGHERIKAYPNHWDEVAMMVHSFLEKIIGQKKHLL
jgi:glycosyltransferase involved in cell wall biosynthesis